MTYYIGFHMNESPFSKFFIMATSKNEYVAESITQNFNNTAIERGRKATYHCYAESECEEFPIEYLED